MKTAVDTNILLDILTDDPHHGAASEAALRAALATGPVCVCPVVVAETLAFFSTGNDGRVFLDEIGITVEALAWSSLAHAAEAWRTYTDRRGPELECPHCGTKTLASCRVCGQTIRTHQHIVADFVIGAHALLQADTLLTRDRGFYRTYFPALAIVEPNASAN